MDKFQKIRKTTQFTCLYWEGSGAGGSVRVAHSWNILLKKYRINPLLTSDDELASIGGFIIFMCIVSVRLDTPNHFSRRIKYSIYQ